MGERSFCTFRVRKRDQAAVVAIEDPEYLEVCDGFIELQYPEMTGGGYELAEKMLAAGIPFIHTWEGLVGAYPPGVAVSDGSNYTDFSAFDGFPAITCQPDGQLNDAIVAEFRAKLTDYRAVKALIQGE